MNAKNIVFEIGTYFVLKTKDSFTVMKNKLTHSESVESFVLDEDGKSCAIAYCKFLSNRRDVETK